MSDAVTAFNLLTSHVCVSSRSGECVHVVVRVRPMNSTEKGDGREWCVESVVHVVIFLIAF